MKIPKQGPPIPRGLMTATVILSLIAAVIVCAWAPADVDVPDAEDLTATATITPGLPGYPPPPAPTEWAQAATEWAYPAPPQPTPTNYKNKLSILTPAATAWASTLPPSSAYPPPSTPTEWAYPPPTTGDLPGYPYP